MVVAVKSTGFLPAALAGAAWYQEFSRISGSPSPAADDGGGRWRGGLLGARSAASQGRTCWLAFALDVPISTTRLHPLPNVKNSLTRCLDTACGAGFAQPKAGRRKGVQTPASGRRRLRPHLGQSRKVDWA
jgi:hypothetical protein